MTYGMGASLANYGQGQQAEAMQALGQTAKTEAELEMQNKNAESQRKAGNTQLGATGGAMAGLAVGLQYGTAAGPWGMVIGGLVGGIAGGLFSALLAVLLAVSLALPQPAEAHMITHADLTQAELHQILAYDPDTGVFTWIDPAARRIKPGDEAGYVKLKPGETNGYRYVKIGATAYAAHRLAWLYMTGAWPAFEIDHRNRTKYDNRFDNLRPATRKQNSENRGARKGAMSGFRGVSWSGGKWSASIVHFGKAIPLGKFDDIELAKAARLRAEKDLFTHSERT